ncbi:hypothetical protein BLNAU_15156 [Blattamonas nauphoetae]|uniref:Uncharacterized protein n=1 Tax=Blattamonas nauphoetae TaxID=2049346 RepID=A0ABQ9XBM6_9EUKA|nr:hypothetical protein BLNAU_15156 [Blattamonas nauphoetae]
MVDGVVPVPVVVVAVAVAVVDVPVVPVVDVIVAVPVPVVAVAVVAVPVAVVIPVVDGVVDAVVIMKDDPVGNDEGGTDESVFLELSTNDDVSSKDDNPDFVFESEVVCGVLLGVDKKDERKLLPANVEEDGCVGVF